MVVYQSPHFANGGRAYAPRSPLLALHEFGAAALADDQVDAAILAAQAGLLHNVAAAAERFADQHLELAPAHAGRGCRGRSGAPG